MLDLKKLLDGSVGFVDFSLSLEDCDFIDGSSGGKAFAEGRITNHSGLVLLSGEIKPNFRVSCARCGKEFDYTMPVSLQAKITDKLANDDEEEFILLQDFALDIDDLVRSTLILEMPSRFLCKEDCKGLCAVCGADLNENKCSCDTTERDPRWDVLKDYFSE